MEFVKFDGHVHALAMCIWHKHYNLLAPPVSPFKLRRIVQRVLNDKISFVLTDHDTMISYRALQANEYKGERIVEDRLIEDLDGALKIGYSGYIICGEEVTSRAGHILAWGIKEPIPLGLSLDETVDAINKADGLVVAPHVYTPLGIGEKNLEKIADRIYAIELSVAIPIKTYQRKILEAAERYMLRIVVGNDAHIPEAICGRGYSLIPNYVFKRDNGEAIIRELKFLQTITPVSHEEKSSIKGFIADRIVKARDIGRYLLTEMPHLH